MTEPLSNEQAATLLTTKAPPPTSHSPNNIRGVKGTCMAGKGKQPQGLGYLLTGNPLSGCNRGTL